MKKSEIFGFNFMQKYLVWKQKDYIKAWNCNKITMKVVELICFNLNIVITFKI